MYRLSLAILIAIFFPTAVNAKYVHEYFAEIEPLLMEKKYDEADIKYEQLNKNIKLHSINGVIVGLSYRDTVKWLKKKDELISFLEKVTSQIENYKLSHHKNGIYANISIKNYSKYHIFNSLNKGLPKTLPFSSEFVGYINNIRKETINRFNTIYENVGTIAKSEEKQKLAIVQAENERKETARKIESARKTKEVRMQREKEKLAREKKKKEKQKILDQEIARIDALAKSVGYSGYEDENIVSLIYKTQKEGGLEKYINQVIGCHKLDQGPCEIWYPKLKAIQILNNGVLYSYSEYSRGEVVSFSVFAEKEPGKIYQEGQAFSNTFYVFTGMLSYTTVMGAKKTIPSFSKAKFK